jgi:D-alanine transaminase
MSSSRIVYLNGDFLPLSEARVSVMDRGFLFGDGVYEVIPFFNDRLFLPEEHLQRLRSSLDAISLTLDLDDQHLIFICQELMQLNPEQGANRAFYLQVTRGTYENREHNFPSPTKPTLFVQCTPFKSSSLEELSQGSSAVTMTDIRWHWCYIKTIALLPNVLCAQEAKMAGSKETILIRDGLALEGTSSNLFIVKNGTMITPPLTQQILPGVTRNLLLKLAAKHHVPYREQDISEAELLAADEVWVTGSIKELVPITKIDNRRIGNGEPGPITLKMLRLYHEFKLP